MMDVIAKVTLVASVILFGYNLYQLLTSYESVCAKVDEFKQLAKESESDEATVKRSNFILTGGLSVAFVALVFFANLAYWMVTVVVLKMTWTMIMSQMEIVRIFKSSEINRNFFRWTKVDAAANALVGLAVAIVVIS